MISCSSSLASSTPATSLNVTFFCCMESRRARLLPKRQRLVAAGLHLAHHEEPERAEQDERSEVQQPTGPASALASFTVMLTPLSGSSLYMSV